VKRPEALLPYAAFLGRRHDTEKALDRCEEARRQIWPPAALTAAGVALLCAVRTPRPADVARVQEWVMEGLSAAANQPAVAAELLNRQAALLNLQGKYDEAIAVYTRLLTLNARDAVAMNNLGYLLAAHKKDFPTALDWVAKAKAVVGPVPQLLDTEALVYLEKAKAERTEDGKRAAAEAAQTLLGDVEVQGPSAVTFFHIALARRAAGDRGAAKAAWGEAQRRKLTLADLHPLERPDFDAVRADFPG
ncbi:MAG TPA: hypothetical protein VM597_14940, partial [Gemmataceae bacterium]|nr:hypothetical protein [Gemmataceae bacterium]